MQPAQWIAPYSAEAAGRVVTSATLFEKSATSGFGKEWLQAASKKEALFVFFGKPNL